jgi:HD-GYP domain-containing protein (c-di-GMP phosphodiesterase class II)
MAYELGLRLDCDEAELTLLRLGGALHDVGKLAVRDEVLSKPGPLSAEELLEVQAHPEIGARMVALDSAFRPVLPAVLYHHERWDGTGYPSGRAGHAIPLAARILAVVDSYDAMTSDRPYRPARSVAQAVEELDRCAGTQFDPEVAVVFLAALEAGAVSLRTAAVAG